MHLPTLTDRELAHHADATFDVLTATDLQVELLKRFTALLDEVDEARDLGEQLADIDIDLGNPDDVTKLLSAVGKAAALDERVNGIALLDALREHDIDDPDTLKKILDRDTKLADVLDSLAQPMADLKALATPA